MAVPDCWISIVLPDSLRVAQASTTLHIIATGMTWINGEQTQATITLALSPEQVAQINRAGE